VGSSYNWASCQIERFQFDFQELRQKNLTKNAASATKNDLIFTINIGRAAAN